MSSEFIKGYIEVLLNGLSFDMINVEGGSYNMGSEDSKVYVDESPVHEVFLDSFYIGKYPVTQALWKEIMGNYNNPSYFKSDSRPVEMISWEDTQTFLQKLNTLTGKTYRLPTEAEWEYAARGGQYSEGYNYAGSNKLGETAWFYDNSYGETKFVGLKYPNELGLYDMSGNVWEWCQDWFDLNYYEECYKSGRVGNPKGPDSGTSRVLRGGSWNQPASNCQCVYRLDAHPRSGDKENGFRLALSI